ncbi:unnamed protein product [Calicophoron daubneyi]|uniref:Myb/SANT-like DNA-binding domain-containing protein n=1 Tax=Calicophoron daubneyi TaxID=300641 RepID=A0AAV2U191_CALDB
MMLPGGIINSTLAASTVATQISSPTISRQNCIIPSTNGRLQPNMINGLSAASSTLATITSGSMAVVPASSQLSISNIKIYPHSMSNSVPSSLTDPAVASLLVSPRRRRTESFVLEEIKQLLREIELRKHVLLSISPSTNRLKRRAWEEVAVSMARRWPCAPRRTADQVKKKWENLVSKTKRKIRAGHTSAEFDWDETNTVVTEFLAQHSPFVRFHYGKSLPPHTSIQSDGTVCTDLARTGFDELMQQQQQESVSSSMLDFRGHLPTLTPVHPNSLCLLPSSSPSSVDGPAPCLLIKSSPPPEGHYESITTSCGNFSRNGSVENPSESAGVVQMVSNSQSKDTVVPHSAASSISPSTTADSPRTAMSDIQSTIRSPHLTKETNNAVVSGDGTVLINSLLAPAISSHPSILHFSPSIGQDFLNLPPVNGSDATTQQKLIEFFNQEHQKRLEILELQKRAWCLQVEILEQNLNRVKKVDMANGEKKCN